MKNLRLIIGGFASITLLSGCALFEIPFAYYTNEGTEKYNQGDFGGAITDFEKAKHITENNRAMALYHLGLGHYQTESYDNARRAFKTAAELCDEDKRLCGDILYGLGNTQYRIGENLSKDAQTETWLSALQNYKQALAVYGEDAQTEENIAFLEEKLNDAENNEQATGSEDQEERSEERGVEDDEQATADEGQEPENEELESESEDQGTPSNRQGAEDDEQQDEQKPEGQSGAAGEESTGGEQETALDEETLQAIEEYKDELEQTERDAGQYFQRDGQADQTDPNDPFSPMMNDPFFQEFFEDSPFRNDPFFNPQLRQEADVNTNEKDW